MPPPDVGRHAYLLRCPVKLHAAMTALARRNERSLNAQLVASLTAWVEGRPITADESAFLRRWAQEQVADINTTG